MQYLFTFSTWIALVPRKEPQSGQPPPFKLHPSSHVLMIRFSDPAPRQRARVSAGSLGCSDRVRRGSPGVLALRVLGKCVLGLAAAAFYVVLWAQGPGCEVTVFVVAVCREHP